MSKIMFDQYNVEFQSPALENMTDEELVYFCEQNKHIPIERDKNHQILFMGPTSSKYSGKNGNISIDLGIWNYKLKAELTFESSV